MSPYSFHPSRRLFLLSTVVSVALVNVPASFAIAAPLQVLGLGRNQPFDNGWRFIKGDTAGAEAKDFNDAGWRLVDLPHDWSIEDLPVRPAPGKPQVVGPFDKKAEGGPATGFTVGGTGWYRKRFTYKLSGQEKVEIHFEGVYLQSEVWINGQSLGTHVNGYTPFIYDLTPHLSPTGENVIAVRVKNEGKNSRWYAGSGIYRHVWLDVTPKSARVARSGVAIDTRRVTNDRAEIDIRTRLDGELTGLSLRSIVRDDKGRKVWEGTGAAQSDALLAAQVPAPRLWSPDAPNLYILETTLLRGKAVLDRVDTTFGIRVVTFDAKAGMTLNGAPVKLRGCCVHHDHGIIGASAFDAAEDRKVRLLKARGYNSVRPSHNLFSPAFLRACDIHGLMVIEETFDTWAKAKLPQDYSVDFAKDWKADLTTIVESTRNHPSIIMWSIGNEIPDRSLPAGIQSQWELANEVHRLDPYRPVTAAINDFPGRPVIPSQNAARPGTAGVPDEASAVFLDIVGYNYKLRKYERDHALYPNRIMYGSESFAKDIFGIWDLTDRSPYLIGDFVWTAMDYLGEAGLGGSTYVPAKLPNPMGVPGGWPCTVSACGDIDLIGQVKTPALARDVVWGRSKLEIAVQVPPPDGKVEVLRPWSWSDERQSWTWPGQDGNPLAVRIFTIADRVDLFVNGKLVESRTISAADLKHVEIKAPYAPGTLEAVAYQNGAEIARQTLTTAGPAAAVALKPETKTCGMGRGDITYVTVEIVDAQGRHAGNLISNLQVALSGPVELVGFGSANPFAVAGFQSVTAQSFDGRAQIILRGTGKRGTVVLDVSGDGLKAGKLSMTVA